MPRVFRLCALLPALLPALLLPALLPWAAAAAEFTPAQRAEIVEIVRQALKQDPSILHDALAAMQTGDARAAIDAVRGKLVTPADPEVGNPKGDVTIVEFFDTRCPYCRAMEPEMEKFVADHHNVRLVYKDLPILGAASVLGSKALLGAMQQGDYAKMRDAVMQLPPDTTPAMIQATAQKLGLNWDRLSHDMDSPVVQQQIADNIKLAHELGIDGTPAMVVGNTLIQGAVDPSDLQQAVTQAEKDKR
ncbi:MAG TPA: DsbA family protein [Acetobacteraceae bacterium]|jgi:protein-disulfide isomerase